MPGLFFGASIVQTVYSIPNDNRNLSKMYLSALALIVTLMLLSLTIGTQFMAHRFNYSVALGPGIWELGSVTIYAPWQMLFWTVQFYRPDMPPVVQEIAAQGLAIMMAGGIVTLILAAVYLAHQRRKSQKQKNDLHGSAHFASMSEISATGLLPTDKNADGCLIGSVMMRLPRHIAGINPPAILHAIWPHYEQQVYLRHSGPEHILVFAPTRSGKGVGIVVPTLLNWSQSVLIHDIKGENWALTSGFRQKALKQRCLRFCPTEVDSVRFNPLAEIRMDDNLVKDVQNIATIIVDPDGKGLNDHWAKTGFDLLTGTILFVLLSKNVADDARNLATVQGVLSDGGVVRDIAEAAARNSAKGGEEAPTGIQAVFEHIRAAGREGMQQDPCGPRHEGWKVAAQAAQAYLNKAPNEASGVLSTALSFLALYRDPLVAQNTAQSDFSIASLMEQKTSLYLVVPPSDKDRLKPLLRLIINQVVKRLTESMDFNPDGSGKSRYPHRLLLLIDEFPALGKLEVFEEALAFIAGYGLKAMLITQDLSQLHKSYSKDESIISNCHIRIAYAPNKIETAELLSKMTGTSTVTQTQYNYSGNRMAVMLGNVSTSEQSHQRALLTADETMRLPPDDALIFVAGHAPIYGRKIKYYTDPALVARQKMGAAVNLARAGAIAGVAGGQGKIEAKKPEQQPVPKSAFSDEDETP